MPAGHFTLDGAWWWSGSKWMRTVSADGLWRWDGDQWQPIEPAAVEADQIVPYAAVTEPAAISRPVARATPPPPPPARGAPRIGSGARPAGKVPGWLAAIACVLFFPAGLVLTWLTSWKQQTKIIASAVTLIFWSVFLISAAVAGSQPTARSTGNVATAQSSAHRVLTITGTGYQTSQPFKIPSPEWILSWTITGDPQFGQVTFQVFSSSGSRVDAIDASTGSDQATVHQGNDVFFMQILDANAKYTAVVTSVYAGADQSFSIPSMSTLTTYSGSGDKSTSTFHVSGSLWVVALHTGPPSQFTSVTAFVMKPDGTQESEVSVEGAQGGSQAISYVYAGAGDYYLKVLAANTTWTATVEQTKV